MLSSANKVVRALSVGGTLIFICPVFAQNADENTSAETTAQSQTGGADEQPAGTISQKLGHDTQAQAEHSAEATAHKSVNDPNNQLGTSLQGRTRPTDEADATFNGTAEKDVSHDVGTQAADPQ